MKLWSIYTKVSTYFQKEPNASLSQAADELEISKSAAGRHRRSEHRRNKHPESEFWNTETGRQWLSRLIVSTLFFFGTQRGIGLESLSLFLKRLRIDTHVGISASSLGKMNDHLSECLIEYESACQRQVLSQEQQIEVIAGFDETFFEQMILVGMDLDSGFIFMEDFSQTRTYDRWFDGLQPQLARWNLKVKLAVSDQASALIKLAKTGCDCLYLPDLFHALHEAVKALGLPFYQKSKQAHKQLIESQNHVEKVEKKAANLPQEIVEDILKIPKEETENKLNELLNVEKGKQEYHNLLHQLSQTVHPFSTENSRPQSSTQVLSKLQDTLEQLAVLKQRFEINDTSECLGKLNGQLEQISKGIDFWWRWVENSLLNYHLDEETYQWLIVVLLPAIYWQYQSSRTDQPKLKEIYQTLARKTQNLFKEHHISKKLSQDNIEFWTSWSEGIVKKFQRASSAVEGRNGYLSQVYHTQRGITPQQLKLLTITHNFELKRYDGTTAAQRLYNIEFPDLFEYLIQNAPPLVLSRQTENRTKSNSLKLQIVPP